MKNKEVCREAVTVTLRNTVGREEKIFLRDLPDNCLVCGEPLVRHSLALSSSQDVIKSTFADPMVYFPLHCSSCHRLNVFRYSLGSEPGNAAYYDLSAKMVAGEREPTIELPDNIRGLSPRFLLVYSQSLAAEGLHLDELVGVGLRKALEILVKDYAISRHPEDRERIEEQFIGQTIREFLDDRYLRECADRAAWLGNDETHYKRLWSGKDIDDLKSLIRLCLAWLNYAIETEHYVKEMPGKEKGERILKGH